MTKKITVLPRDDGHDFQGSWMVHVSGKMKSNHTTKQAAKNAAREYASEGDTLEIRNTDGKIQKTVTVQSSRSSGTDENPTAFMPGKELVDTGVSDFFR